MQNVPTIKSWNRRLAAFGLSAAFLIGSAGASPIASATDLNTCTPSDGFDFCRAFHFTGSAETAYLTEDMVGATVTIEAWGGGGGGSNYGWSSQSGGGGGGYVWAQFYVSAPTELAITVGEGGSSADTDGTYGGGGAGGTASWAGASGGGFTGVWTTFTGTFNTSTPLLIAAGGGGISPGTWQVSAGGGGGGTTGGNGGSTPEEHGQGATQLAGGAAATFTGACSTAPQAGSAYQGGAGANSSDNREGGGGGGGGYFGGGGGRCQDNSDALQNGAGGGGSSFIATHPDLVSLTTFGGANGYYDAGLGYGIGGNSGGAFSPAYLTGVGKGGDISQTAGASDGGDGMVVIQWAAPVVEEPQPTAGPTITGVSPSTAEAGDPVSLEGSDLGGATSAEVGGIDVPFEYIGGSIIIETDGLPQGRHDITITTNRGRATLVGGLTILDPESFWTKQVNANEVKIYAKHVVGIGKVTFHVDGREIAWIDTVDSTDPKLRKANGAFYLVRTVQLHSGKNRFEIKVDGVRQRRATYVP